jgi:hypothetical protein
MILNGKLKFRSQIEASLFYNLPTLSFWRFYQALTHKPSLERKLQLKNFDLKF